MERTTVFGIEKPFPWLVVLVVAGGMTVALIGIATTVRISAVEFQTDEAARWWNT